MDSQKQNQTTLDDSIKQVMQTLPPPIRHYLGQGKYSIVAQRLMATYGLHIDQSTILEREIMLLLMGIENPDEFVKALAEEAKLDQETINGITQDVNAQIFVPLRDEMKKAATMPTPRVAQVAPVAKPVIPAPRIVMPPPRPTMPVPAAVVPPPPPVPRPAPRVAEMPPFSNIIQANPRLPERPQQDYISKVSKYAPPPVRQPVPSKFPPRPSLTMQKPAQPMNINANRMLEDHEEPSPSLATPRPMMNPSVGFKPPVPAQRVYTPPTHLPAQVGLPGAMPPRPVSAPIPPRPTAPIPPPIPLKPKPPIQSYSSDPYHEPIDESHR